MTEEHTSVPSASLTLNLNLTNNWTEQKIKKLNEWSHISKIYSTCHSKAQEYYHKQFNRITVAVIACGALAAILEGANLLLASPSIGLGVTVVLLTSAVSGLNLWLNSKNPSETASAHESMSKGYNRIILKIESELANDDKERENGVTFLTEIRDNLTDLSTGGKSIPLSIWYDVNKDHVSVSVTRNRTVRVQQQAVAPVPVEAAPVVDVENGPSLAFVPDLDAIKVADLLEKYQTARYRSAY
jgi:hypothetical protein